MDTYWKLNLSTLIWVSLCIALCHVPLISNKASKVLNFLKCNQNIPRKSKQQHNTLIPHPLLEYTSIVWDMYILIHWKNTEKCKIGLYYIIFNWYYSSMTVMLQSLNWHNLIYNEHWKIARLSFFTIIMLYIIDIPSHFLKTIDPLTTTIHSILSHQVQVPQFIKLLISQKPSMIGIYCWLRWLIKNHYSLCDYL